MSKILKVESGSGSEYHREALPHELIVDHILPRLPLKSVVRFKCVRRSWLSEISTHSFQRSYLKVSSNNTKFLLFQVNPRRKIFSLSYDEAKGIGNDLIGLRFDDVVEHNNNFVVVDSCDGVVCMWVRLIKTDCFSLWNPTTNEYKTLPLVPHHKETVEEVVDASLQAVGFGYATSVEAYKIIGMYTSVRYGGIGYCYLFSTNIGEWKRLGHIDGTKYPRSICDKYAVCIDDTLYWPLRNVETRVMTGLIGFDLKSEELKDPLEVYWLRDYDKVDHIFKTRDWLSLCCRKYEIYNLDVWVLKQDDNEQCWTKMYTIDRSDRSMSVLGFTGNDKYLVQRRDQLKLIELEDQDPEESRNGANICVNCSSKIVACIRHVESLISF